jgi:hypothetical protein
MSPHLLCTIIIDTEHVVCTLSLQRTSLQPAFMMDYIFTLLMSTGDDYTTFLPNIAEPIESTHLCNTENHNLHTHGHENRESYIV